METLSSWMEMPVLLVMAAICSVFGWQLAGSWGATIGVVVGMGLGWILIQLRLITGFRWLIGVYARMPEEQLVAELRSETCRTPLAHRLELSRRGFDFSRELLHMHDLLSSDDIDRRNAGWSLVQSTQFFDWLPEVSDDYDPTESTEECRIKCRLLLEAAEAERKRREERRRAARK